MIRAIVKFNNLNILQDRTYRLQINIINKQKFSYNNKFWMNRDNINKYLFSQKIIIMDSKMKILESIYRKWLMKIYQNLTLLMKSLYKKFYLLSIWAKLRKDNKDLSKTNNYSIHKTN